MMLYVTWPQHTEMEHEFILHYFPFFIIIFWILACFILSKLGGWYKISQNYPVLQVDTDEVETFDFQSLKLGKFIDYNSCITMQITKEGILMKVLPIFKIMHPPFFIKYSEIENATIDNFYGFKTMTCYVRGRKMQFMGPCVQSLNTKLSKDEIVVKPKMEIV